jgi:hypothetical protein
MPNWIGNFNFDPRPALLNADNPAIRYFSQRDLIGEEVGPVEMLWELPNVRKILRKQKQNGAWFYPNRQTNLRASEDYNQIETYRSLGLLVEKYGLDRRHKAIQGRRHSSFHAKQMKVISAVSTGTSIPRIIRLQF